MRKLTILAVLLLVPTAHAADPIGPGDVTGPVAWGDTVRVTALDNLRFGGQPDEEALRAAGEAGVEIVVNLRSPDEDDFDERAAAESLGLEYHNVPLVKGAPLDGHALEKIEAIVGKADGRTVYLHCKSGNRAAAWLATHLVERQGMPKADALVVAERVGLRKDPLRASTEDYLDGWR